MDANKFKSLWSQQALVPQPDTEMLLKSALRIKNKSRNQLLITMFLGISTIVIIAAIAYFITPELITTSIGIALIILSIVFFLISSSGLLRLLLSDADATLDTAHYLSLLIQIKEKQLKIGTTIMTLYFVALGGGILLFMFEYTKKMTLTAGIVTYAVTVVWILFNWVYLKPKIVLKQQEKIGSVIKELEKLTDQLS
jgi:membrane protein YdbS with pleckstrin-like domain